MTEWWTYRPEHFLLFSERVYWRLLELYNAELWPWQAGALLIGVFVLYLSWRPYPRSGVLISGVMGLLWLIVAWSYLWSHYATINWAATYMAGAFVVQGILWIVIGVPGKRFQMSAQTGIRRSLGGGMVLYAVVIHPFAAIVIGRFPAASEVFGLTPDPLVIASLGMLVLSRINRMNLILWLLPCLWCLVSGVTLMTMGSPTALVLLLSPLIALVAIIVAKYQKPA
ncbi:DUF6064 family protein [Hahella ganghwensis]|uniref:DUF6064 family protein n=1 Tax=Hahella ganghwensis TaxID=286420 RepID=UPI000367845F|nr:DUF6064 family protein [Hahella ganghwensis]